MIQEMKRESFRCETKDQENDNIESNEKSGWVEGLVGCENHKNNNDCCEGDTFHSNDKIKIKSDTCENIDQANDLHEIIQGSEYGDVVIACKKCDIDFVKMKMDCKSDTYDTNDTYCNIDKHRNYVKKHWPEWHWYNSTD